jgi:hypothetical protein
MCMQCMMGAITVALLAAALVASATVLSGSS